MLDLLATGIVDDSPGYPNREDLVQPLPRSGMAATITVHCSNCTLLLDRPILLAPCHDAHRSLAQNLTLSCSYSISLITKNKNILSSQLNGYLRWDALF